MPKLPMNDAPLSGAPDAPVDAGLPAGAKDRMARLREGDDAIERARAASQSLLDAGRALRVAETEPAEIGPDFTGRILGETDRAHAAMLRATPADQRPRLEKDLREVRNQIAGLAADTEATGRGVRRRLALRDVLDANAELVRLDVRALDSAAARMNGVIDALDLPAERRDALRAHVRGVLGDAAVDGLLDDPADAQAALAAGRFDGYLDRQARAARSQEIDALLERRTVQANGRDLLGLSQQAASGALDTAALDAAVSEGRIGVADASRLRSLDANARAEAEARRADVQRVAAADSPLDPDSAEDQHAVDAYWDTVKESFAADDPAAARKAELGFVSLKGVLPTALRRKYEGLLLSADPALVVSGAGAVAALEKIDPRLIRDIPPDRLRLARAVAGYADRALPPDRAVALARDEMDRTAEAASAAAPEGDRRMTPPSQAARSAVPRIELDPGATVAVDRDLANRVFRTSRGFTGFVEELRQLSPEDAIARARNAGLDGNTARIVLDILDAAGSDGDRREAILQHVERSIDQLRGADDRTKRRLTDMLAGVRKVIDDPEKLIRVLAVNRDLFRGRPGLANVDPNALEARRLAEFQRKTGLIARPVTETLTPQQGDPDDLTDVVTRDVGSRDATGSRHRIAFFRPGSETPFVTLPLSAANALMSRPEKAAERLDFIAKWRSGELAGDDLIAAARKIFIDDQGHSLVLGGGDIVNREAFDAFLEAKDRIDAGEDSDAVLAALMPSLISQAYQDPAALADLVLDMLPVIGDVRAALDVFQDIESYRAARAKGDTAGQIEAAAMAGIGLLGFLPAAGVLSKNARIAIKNYLRKPEVAHKLRNSPRLKTVHSRLVLPRRVSEAVGESDRVDPADVFGSVWNEFNAKQQETIGHLFSHIRGQATEKEFRTLLKNAGFDLVDEQNLRTIMTSEGARIFDQGSRDGFNVFFRTFVLPKKGGRGTLFENKPLGSDGPKKQLVKNKEIRNQLNEGQRVNSKQAKPTTRNDEADEIREQLEIEDFLILRADIKEIPTEFLVERANALLSKHTLPGKNGEAPLLTEENVRQLVGALRSWHAGAQVESGVRMNVGQMLMMLGSAATQMAEINKRESQKNSMSEPLGA